MKSSRETVSCSDLQSMFGGHFGELHPMMKYWRGREKVNCKPSNIFVDLSFCLPCKPFLDFKKCVNVVGKYLWCSTEMDTASSLVLTKVNINITNKSILRCSHQTSPRCNFCGSSAFVVKLTMSIVWNYPISALCVVKRCDIMYLYVVLLSWPPKRGMLSSWIQE